MRHLKRLAVAAEGPDQVVLSVKLSELEHLAVMTKSIETEILRVYKQWPDAQRLDEIYGIGPISAVSI